MVYQKLSENRTGGYDSDFASYSSSGQWRQYAVVQCQNSPLAMYGSDMALGILEEYRDAALKAATQAVKKARNPDNLEVWERYMVAIEVYRALGRDPVFLGDMWLQASWTARDAAIGYYAGLSGPVVARQLLNAGWDELKKPLDDKNRKNVLYNLARIAHRGGYSTERDAYLTTFETLGLDERERTALARFREIAHTIEPALQANVVQEYQQALQGKLTPEIQDRLRYTLADIYRRNNEKDKAIEAYKQIFESDASDELRGLAQFFLDELT